MRFQVIPVNLIIPDPTVQFDWTYDESRVRQMAANYDDALAGVIDVAPLNGDKQGLYGAFVGRHRLAAATLAGVKSMRCDVWPATLSVAEKHRIKLGKDRDRRQVKRVELFLSEVGAQEPTACAILQICQDHGYTVGKCKAGKPYTCFEAVAALEIIYNTAPDHLKRVLAFNTLWIDEPATNQAKWLGGISTGVADTDGWIDRISPTGYARLKSAIPLKILRTAIAESTHSHAGYGVRGDVPRLIADKLRKIAQVRRRQ